MTYLFKNEALALLNFSASSSCIYSKGIPFCWDSICSWAEMPWTAEPGGLQSQGLQESDTI